MPLVSVIIPNFNHAIHLDQRIQSVLNQTCQDFELIILDDCSTDNSRDIIEKYRPHPKVHHVVFNEQNSGSTFKQWRKGIELAKGEWVWIAESDDWCEKTLLEELVTQALQNPDIVIAFCQSIVVSPESKILYTTSAGLFSEIIDGKEFVRNKMLGVNSIVNASMAIFKKSTFSNVPDGYAQMKYCGDWLFWVHICLQGKVFVSGKYLNYYPRHENNVTTMAVRKGYDFLEGNQVFNFIVKEVGVNPQQKKEGLDIRVTMYMERKDQFLNDNIRYEVLQSLLTLDPSMHAIIEKKMQELRRRKFRSAVRQYLKLFLSK